MTRPSSRPSPWRTKRSHREHRGHRDGREVDVVCSLCDLCVLCGKIPSEKAIRRSCRHVRACTGMFGHVPACVGNVPACVGMCKDAPDELQLQLGAVAVDPRVVDPPFFPRFRHLLGAECSCQRRVSRVELPWSRVENHSCHLDVVCLLNIGGFTGANGIAERLQIAGNDGAMHADLVGDLLLGVSGEVQLVLLPPPFGQLLANPWSFASWSYSDLCSGANPPAPAEN